MTVAAVTLADGQEGSRQAFERTESERLPQSGQRETSWSAALQPLWMHAPRPLGYSCSHEKQRTVAASVCELSMQEGSLP